jgi:CelD/BcsL family acetyltransferase involved in cellulose biosynthesis
MGGVPEAADVELITLAPAELGAWEPAWRDLERRAPDAPPFVCFDWLAARVLTYTPRRLAVVVVGARDEPAALGLLELTPGGRWGFAGRPVSTTRALLAAPADEARAWASLAAWLRAHPRRWSRLDMEGISPSAASALPQVRQVPTETPVLGLSENFDAYLAQCPRKSRSRYRRVLRRVEREGAELRQTTDIEGALADFIRLHRERAVSKGERHPAIDEQLARMLATLRSAPSVELHLLELVRDGRRLGVWVGLDRGAISWYYNLGISPDALWLAPGVALQLLSISDAIERGRRCIDLGPGAHRYKLELGGVVGDRVDARAVSPSPRGRGMALLGRLKGRSRDLLRKARRR